MVRGLFEDLGVATIDADSVGHEVLTSDPAVREAVSERWPAVVSDENIDRKALAAVVFADRSELKALESITHPRIFEAIGERVAALEGPVVVEVPVIGRPLEGQWGRMVVDAPDETRIGRAVERGSERGDVEARMAMQPGRGTWLASADAVIPNWGDLDELREAVMSVFEELFA